MQDTPPPPFPSHFAPMSRPATTLALTFENRLEMAGIASNHRPPSRNYLEELKEDQRQRLAPFAQEETA